MTSIGPIYSVYLDSPVFIGAISGSATVTPAERLELREILTQIDRGAVVGVISTFVMAEVRQFKPNGVAPDFDPQEADRVSDMFRNGNLVVRPVTEAIALRAADIGNEVPQLMPGDCVHIATAEQYGVDVLFTRDGVGGRRRPKEMLTHDKRFNGLRILPPFATQGPLWDHLKMTQDDSGQPAAAG